MACTWQRLFLFSLLWLATGPINAQPHEQVLKVCFWNVENLFDPADNPATNDDEFTPEGERRWTHRRQYAKLLRLTQVLMAIGEGQAPALVGLAEVENDAVMQRWTRHTPLRKWNYRYVMTDSRDRRGINVALMYDSAVFHLLGHESWSVVMPRGINPTRDLLHAWGQLHSGDTLDVVVCHLPSRRGGAMKTAANRRAVRQRLQQAADSLLRERQSPRLLVMGDMNASPQASAKSGTYSGLINLMLPLERALMRTPGRVGSYKFRGEWTFLDHLLVNEAMLDSAKAVWVSGARSVAFLFMLTDDVAYPGHRPLQEYRGFGHEGGFSDHLPVCLDLRVRL